MRHLRWRGKTIAFMYRPMPDAPRLSIWDMDKTITRRPTWTPFLIHVALRRSPWRLILLPVAGIAGLGYRMGLMSRTRLKELAQRWVIGPRLTAAEANALADSYAADIVRRGLFAKAHERVLADRADGYRTVMATASFGFYAAAIARALDFDGVIATPSARDERDHILPRVDGENCYGPAKRRMVEAWLAEQGIDRPGASIRFYSDHVSDAPMLELADEAFAVNPHPPLRRLAKRRGWTIIDWH
ncbi:HAD family hydrolase [Sphingomonas sp. CJ99]